MTKRDLVMRIASDTGLTQQTVYSIIQGTLNIITDALNKGETVELRNFGIFKVVTKRARRGINPNHPEIKINIPARKAVVFKQGKKMKETVN